MREQNTRRKIYASMYPFAYVNALIYLGDLMLSYLSLLGSLLRANRRKVCVPAVLFRPMSTIRSSTLSRMSVLLLIDGWRWLLGSPDRIFTFRLVSARSPRLASLKS
jgi:hypothetical protein